MFKKITILLFLLSVAIFHLTLAETINPDNPQQGWKDNRAYKPCPILFLHGFAGGSPNSWKESKVDEFFNKFYSKYYSGYNLDPAILPSTRYPYLELIDFGSSLIDRNSSVDTYKAGDRYVLVKERNPGDPGWSDKLSTAVDTLRESYRNRDGSSPKVILVAHSMGGLAARKYLKDYSYANQKVKKLIMIGTPNLGSILATNAILYNRTRRSSWYSFFTGGGYPAWIIAADKILESRRYIDIDGDAVWDMDYSSTGSGFLADLNSNHSESVDHFVIAGNTKLDFNKGDMVISLDSQLGAGVLLLKNKVVIPVDHASELSASILGDNPLLKFLDSEKPELELTSPTAGSTNDIAGNSFSITGKVYKEYLPADSKLVVDILRQDDGWKSDPLEFSLKPSDLWVPDDPDSPVAEINETIVLPGKGTYKVSCYVKNPAGLTSDNKEFSVNISVWGTGVIVHAHNPEGKEINGLLGGFNDRVLPVEIYDGYELKGRGAQDANSHNGLISLAPGRHTIRVQFNWIIEEQNIDLKANEVKTLTFTFKRKEIKVPTPPKIERSLDVSGTHHYPPDPGVIRICDEPGEQYLVDPVSICFESGSTYGEEFLADYSSQVNVSLDGWKWFFSIKQKTDLIMPDRSMWSAYTEVCLSLKLCTIPANNFDRWIIQVQGQGYFPIQLRRTGHEPNYLSTDIPNLVSADEPYDVYIAGGGTFFDDVEWLRSATITNIKVSSIPYDLKGDAI